MRNATFTLECKTDFLVEKRNKPYKKYGARVSEPKNKFSAKSNLINQIYFGLERRGA